MDARWAWVALALVPEVGWSTRRYHDLLTVAEPARLFAMEGAELRARLGPAMAEALRRFDAAGHAARQEARGERAGARVVTLHDPDYPALLRQVALPPPFLVVRGTLAREDALAVAMVGSRRASPYGLRVAEGLARDLAARGVTVVSGLARGVDAAAHGGALEAGGRTLAVLGSGVDVVYPPEHRRLADRVVEAGALVSPFPLGTPPLAHHFPLRNRVVAGLALGAVVVEAHEKSGALITARWAAELGREVYAVPGSISAETSAGPHRLIQDGAKLVRTWEDVVAEWPESWRRALRPGPSPGREGEPGAGGELGFSRAERSLLALLGDDPVALDGLVEASHLSAAEVAASLMTLELRGLVRQLPGQRYVRR